MNNVQENYSEYNKKWNAGIPNNSPDSPDFLILPYYGW